MFSRISNFQVRLWYLFHNCLYSSFHINIIILLKPVQFSCEQNLTNLQEHKFDKIKILLLIIGSATDMIERISTSNIIYALPIRFYFLLRYVCSGYIMFCLS